MNWRVEDLMDGESIARIASGAPLNTPLSWTQQVEQAIRNAIRRREQKGGKG